MTPDEVDSLKILQEMEPEKQVVKSVARSHLEYEGEAGGVRAVLARERDGDTDPLVVHLDALQHRSRRARREARRERSHVVAQARHLPFPCLLQGRS